MKDIVVTVFTATYNRGYSLQRLYNSLVAQINTQFEWIIIDDGSNDNTKDIVNKFIDENKLIINYLYKINEGKHIAINQGAVMALGEWFFIVDSDDYLTDNSIDIVIKQCNQIKNSIEIIGVAGLKGDNNGKTWMKYGSEKKEKFNKLQEKINKLEYIDLTSTDYRYKYKIKGDRAEVIRTSVLRKHLFPKFDSEKFISEGYLWFSLSKAGYKIRWFNQIIYIAEYLSDGLSNNYKQLLKQNWQGTCFHANFMLTIKEVSLKDKVHNCINYYRYGHYGGKTHLYRECNNKILSLLCIPISFAYKLT